MKIINILNSKNVLTELANCKALSATAAYRIAKNIKLANTEIEIYEEQRMKLLEKYADKDEDGNPVSTEHDGMKEYQMSDENKKRLYVDINALLREDSDVEFKKIKLDQLDGANLSPIDLMNIEYMIDEE